MSESPHPRQYNSTENHMYDNSSYIFSENTYFFHFTIAGCFWCKKSCWCFISCVITALMIWTIKRTFFKLQTKNIFVHTIICINYLELHHIKQSRESYSLMKGNDVVTYTCFIFHQTWASNTENDFFSGGNEAMVSFFISSMLFRIYM